MRRNNINIFLCHNKILLYIFGANLKEFCDNRERNSKELSLKMREKFKDF